MTVPVILEAVSNGFAIAAKWQIRSYIKHKIEEGTWGEESELVSVNIRVGGKPIKAYASWTTIECLFLDLVHPKDALLDLRIPENIKRSSQNRSRVIEHCLISPSDLVAGADESCLPLPLAIADISDSLLKWKTASQLTADLVSNAVLVEGIIFESIGNEIIQALDSFMSKFACEWFRSINDDAKEFTAFSQKQEKEKKIQKRLATRLKGRMEVSTPSGDIDILTENEVIEVKGCQKWKNAVGQVIAYQQYFPDKRKRIHLFDSEKMNSSTKATIETVCANLDICVTYD